MLTPPVRSNARKDGCIGLVCFAIAGVILVGGWAMFPQVQDAREALAYGGSVLLFALGFAIAGLILLTYAVNTERDCDEIDANTRSYDPNAVHGGPGYSGPTLGAIHYDGNVPDSVQVSVDGVRYEMDTRTGKLS